MATRVQLCERRLRDAYPAILRNAGLDEAVVESLMASYDSPVIRTESPVSAAFLLRERARLKDATPHRSGGESTDAER